MDLKTHALNVASAADRLGWETRAREVDGRKVVILPVEEASALKELLIVISHGLNDAADDH